MTKPVQVDVEPNNPWGPILEGKGFPRAVLLPDGFCATFKHMQSCQRAAGQRNPAPRKTGRLKGKEKGRFALIFILPPCINRHIRKTVNTTVAVTRHQRRGASPCAPFVPFLYIVAAWWAMCSAAESIFPCLLRHQQMLTPRVHLSQRQVWILSFL